MSYLALAEPPRLVAMKWTPGEMRGMITQGPGFESGDGARKTVAEGRQWDGRASCGGWLRVVGCRRKSFVCE